VSTKFKISPQEKVITLGSCFSQNLSRFLTSAGFNYFVTEKAPTKLSLEQGHIKQYGIFSARYGNVYTIRQALQLLGRAFEIIPTPDDIWMLNKKFVDPFRPSVEPEGFLSREDLMTDRKAHMLKTREAFEGADVLVLTLGLSESWLSRVTGFVYPLAPGVHGGEFNPDLHIFYNFNVMEVTEDLASFCSQLKQFNAKIKIILSVSPVHIAATYEDTHVLTASVYSKSLLRVACENIRRSLDYVDYFPGYELLVGPHHAGRYLELDLRHVNELGLDRVMSVFTKSFLEGASSVLEAPLESALPLDSEIICDEDKLNL